VLLYDNAQGRLSQQQDNPAAAMAWLATVLVHRQDGLADQESWHPIHTNAMEFDEERLSDKVTFLTDVRTWLEEHTSARLHNLASGNS
jgi:hypothetical protein